MSTPIIIGLYVIQISIGLIVIYWLSKKHEGSKVHIIISAIIATIGFGVFAMYYFIIYVGFVLIFILMLRSIAAEIDSPKNGGIVLGLFFGFYLSFPLGVYQYAT